MKNPWKKQKNLEFFWFFAFLQLRLPSKNQKNPRFFLVFKNLNQKKTKKLKENQKKPSFDLKPKLLQKVLVFWFFWFSRGFVKIRSCWKRRVLLKKEEFLRLYTTFWKYKIDAKKNKHLNIVKSNKIAQIPVNSEKVWVLGGGVPYIYIYI